MAQKPKKQFQKPLQPQPYNLEELDVIEYPVHG